jgi:hypothetical protein
MNDWTRPVYGTATSTLRRRAADSASGCNADSWHPLLTASSSIRTEPKAPVARPAARFHDNPLVTGTPGIRSYAGRPLAAPNGATIGTLCLIDTQPRSLEPDELALLGDRVTQALALRHAADVRGNAIRFSIGNVAYDPAHHHAVADLLASTDHRMYEDKQRGKTAGT